MAAAVVAIYVGPVLSFQASRCDDIAGQVAALKSQLPDGAKLVSLGQLHHGFLFYYRDAIPLEAWPALESDFPSDSAYFAVHTYRREPPPLPFDWELVDVVSCDRFRKGEPRDRIYVGKKNGASQKMATSEKIGGGL